MINHIVINKLNIITKDIHREHSHFKYIAFFSMNGRDRHHPAYISGEICNLNSWRKNIDYQNFKKK
ncbi:MAG: hypothetical protein A2Y62_18830 [Candidatus Fischerbacteria bacterium RBG_13_37_8]|uniref:Uncharacterized protein n=1 Tax=Candidatus Fischerbacteria bacterium RBG_13_37_8 TaxID=1817863 RepID=A0A1F5VJK6_9BACT|nr:MAG: hypothetical protein A2Y62_18830 [Candidatus Fischerbacteria bacterium RBG_13_37_8]